MTRVVDMTIDPRFIEGELRGETPVVHTLQGTLSKPDLRRMADLQAENARLRAEVAQLRGDPMRCAECDCANGGRDCNWIKWGASHD